MTKQSLPRHQTPTRPGRSCRAIGYALEDVAYDHETGELTEAASICLICRGMGVFAYPKHAEGRL